MNREAGDDVEDGGVDLPRNTDGITRYPSQGGNIIGSDELDAYDRGRTCNLSYIKSSREKNILH